MEKDVLLRREVAIRERFDEVKEEIMRLQGEHRLVMDLINGLEAEGNEPEPEFVEPAAKPKRLRKKVVENAED